MLADILSARILLCEPIQVLMFGFRNPFPVLVPCPTRRGVPPYTTRPSARNPETMTPDTIAFSANIITVTYHRRRVTRGWWDSRAIHEFEWFPDLKTVENVLRYHAKTLHLTRRQRDSLIASRKGRRCGKGRLIHLTADLMRRIEGRTRAGGKEPIYLLSASGEQGALKLGTSHYQSYDVTKFRISPSDYSELPSIDEEPQEVVTLTV